MAKIRSIQSSYVSGEFDPTLFGRVDIEDYSQGADKLRNVYVRPQGGVFRREGLEYYAQVNNDDVARMVPFQFNDEQTYILVFTAGRMDVYRTDIKTLQATVTSSPISAMTDAQIAAMNWTQSADTLILFHKDFQPIQITRTSHTAWTAAAITFLNIPPYAYSGASTATPAATILPDTFTGQVTLHASAAVFSSGNVGQFINSPKGGRVYITEYISTKKVKGIVRVELETVQDNFPSSSITITAGATTGSSITVTASAAVFIASHVGQYIRTPENGVAVITGYTSSTVVTVDILTDLEATTPIENWSLALGYESGAWELETGYEDVMSATRGWARSGTFHKSRLVLGGLSSRPQTILMSKIGEFFDLDLGEGLDSDGIDVTLDTAQVNAIRNVFSGRGLNIFTSGGEFSIRSDFNSAVTPANIADQVQQETRHGSSQIRPVSLDGAVVFVERDDPADAASGRTVRQFVFNDVEQSFIAPNISIFSQHLISNPVSMDIRRSTTDQPSNYLYMVNDDGTCAVLNSLREQSLLAWTLFETDGLFEDVVVSGNKAFFIVNRTVDGGTVRFIEVLNQDNKMDGSLTATNGTATTSWSGFDHLDGQESTVIGNGFILDSETPSSGAITSSVSVSSLEVGFPFYARIKHLPMSVIVQGQSWSGDYMAPIYANIRVYASRDFIVKHDGNTTYPLLEEFAAEYTEENATLYTMWKRVFIGGVAKDVQIEITQDAPFDLNILAVNFGVRFS